jgi:DNA-binding NtrC family response regulator
MRLLLFPLSTVDARAQKWLDGLSVPNAKLELILYDKRFAANAVWLGDPFIVVGDSDHLNAYLTALDHKELEILNDCAYFWLLTENESFTHAKLQTDRLIALSWHTSGQNVVREALRLLQSFPRLKGLSKRMHFIREEIKRISSGPVSPGYSVLILGDSGVGKEEVAQSLFKASERGKRRAAGRSSMYAVGGAWLNMEPGMALTELIGIAPNRSDKSNYAGLLKLFSNGALFIDDFESSPVNVQETLLRIMSTRRGRPAIYRQVGGMKDESTLVWLVFATNANLQKLRDASRLREDFLYRFEDRVLIIPPLTERPADFPAICHAMWRSLWDSPNREADVLRSSHVREIYGRKFKWEGNVRTLRALFALVVSMRRNPAHNHRSVGALIEMILARGDTYWHWVRIFETKFYVTGQSLVEEIGNADSGHKCFGSTPGARIDENQLLPSERKALEVLTPEGWSIFKKLLSDAPPTKSKDVLRVSVRLARVIWYVSQAETITIKILQELTGVKSDQTARGDLAILANYDLKDLTKRKLRGPGPALLFERPGKYLFTLDSVLANDLKTNSVSETLKREFRDNRTALVDPVTIETRMENEWIIGVKERTYVVKYDDFTLNVYEGKTGLYEKALPFFR